MTATPFEAAGGTAFTSLAAEAAFVDSLVAANPSKVSKSALGQSVQGRDIYALTFGTGTGSPLLMITTVHGDETLPREAALTLVRDLCETAHPWAGLLAERPLILVPTPNPDGFNTLTRNNANGLDLNRHYVPYTSDCPESRLLVGLFYSDMPAATYDGHEWNGNPGDCYIGAANFTAVDREIRAAMIETGEHVASELIAFGVASAPWYTRDSPEKSVQHLSALNGVPFFLMETAEVAYGDPSRYQSRHDRHEVAMHAWLDWMSVHAAEYEVERDAARLRMAGKVDRGDFDWPIVHQSPIPPAQWSSAESAHVTAEAYVSGDSAALTPVLDAHGITYSGSTVPLTQARASLAAYICDPLGLNLGDCTRTQPTVTWSGSGGPSEPTPEFQLWSSVI